MSKKVLLINPRKGWRPALGLLYIASYLRQANYQVKVLEFIDEDFFPGENGENWREFHEYDPDIIGFGIISWNRRVARGMIDKIRQETQNKVIVCGGKDPNFKPDYYLNNGVDFVVFSEGENSMVELLNCLDDPTKKVDDVAGIGFLRDEKMITTPVAPLISMDNLLFPALDLVDFDHYSNIRLGGIPGHFIKTGFMMASRGCPYSCRFCTDPVRVRYRERPVDEVVDEIKWQMKNWNIDGMVLLDDLFYYRDERVNEFCKKIIEEVINSTGATSIKDMGQVMSQLKEKSAGKIDMKIASNSVREKLL